MLWILLVYPLMFAACLYTGHRRVRANGGAESLICRGRVGGPLCLAACVTMDLVVDYDYFMPVLMACGITLRHAVPGVMHTASLSAPRWKSLGDVERRPRAGMRRAGSH